MIRHLNKNEGPNALYRGGGSIAFVAACRLAWLAGRDPKMPGQFVLAQPKNNFAARQPSLAYALPIDKARVEWHGPSMWSAADLIVRRRARPTRQRAAEFLLAFLAKGPRLWSDILNAAGKLRLSEKTLRRVKDELKIRSERIRSQGQRMDFWLLEGQEVPTGLSDTPEADELLRQLGEQWKGREPMGNGDEDEGFDDEEGDSCESDEKEI